MAAESVSGEPERRAGKRRLAPGDRPDATLDQAKDACLRLLAVRARSRAELAKRLGERGFRVDIIEEALTRLSEVDLIDDAAFAHQWVHERHTYGGKGKKALQRELKEKGVDELAMESALAQVSDRAERARAAELVRRKVRTLPPGLTRDKAVRRLVGMLARRGYDQSTAFAVVNSELAGVEFAPAKSPVALADSASPPQAADDEEAARELVRRKLRGSTETDRAKLTRRLVDMLARRGYGPSVAYAVVKEELAQRDL
nr:regulatory protein RecX [Nocardia camponoti]